MELNKFPDGMLDDINYELSKAIKNIPHNGEKMNISGSPTKPFPLFTTLFSIIGAIIGYCVLGSAILMIVFLCVGAVIGMMFDPGADTGKSAHRAEEEAFRRNQQSVQRKSDALRAEYQAKYDRYKDAFESASTDKAYSYLNSGLTAYIADEISKAFRPFVRNSQVLNVYVYYNRVELSTGDCIPYQSLNYNDISGAVNIAALAKAIATVVSNKNASLYGSGRDITKVVYFYNSQKHCAGIKLSYTA